MAIPQWMSSSWFVGAFFFMLAAVWSKWGSTAFQFIKLQPQKYGQYKEKRAAAHFDLLLFLQGNAYRVVLWIVRECVTTILNIGGCWVAVFSFVLPWYLLGPPIAPIKYITVCLAIAAGLLIGKTFKIYRVICVLYSMEE